MDKFTEEKARDALIFDPLPMKWITSDAAGIIITTRYSEPLSRLLRSLPGAKWSPESRQWRYPFTSAEAIRAAFADIDRLAGIAQESAGKETARQIVERLRIDQERHNKRQEIERRRAMALPRTFREEFLRSLPGKPRFALRIEAIADNERALPRRYGVSQLFGSNGRGGLVRVNLSGAKDYARANSLGSRGIFVTYFLEEGPLYEIKSPQTWTHTKRYFARIIDGAEREMSLQEIEQCLVSLG